jgi:hypothetical protein
MLIFDLQVWPWPLRYGSGCWARHIVSLTWTIVESIYKIPSKIRKLWTGHDIYPQIDNVDLGWASVTLTLEVRVWLLRMTHRLIITNICANLFQIPFINDKVMDRTRKCDGRTDGQTDGRTDRRTDGQTDGAYFYIPLFSSKRRGTIIFQDSPTR